MKLSIWDIVEMVLVTMLIWIVVYGGHYEFF